MIRVLVVDDSAVVQQHLTNILQSDPDIRVIATASDGQQAIDLVARKKPDVITMDIFMPRMDGYEATQRIMETRPTPIVVVSQSYDPHEAKETFRATEAGAVAILVKPVGKDHPQYEEMAKELVDMVKLMSEVKVLTRRPSLRRKKAIHGALRDATKRPSIEIVAIGTSTGGPQVLKTILSQLPQQFRVPILIVQHIAPGFSRGLVDWLNTSSTVPIYLATHRERFAAGCAYVAPQELQMGVNNHGQIVLSEDPKEHGHRPSVSYLFRSVADTFGQGAVGVLLTGMGKDGAGELKLMKEKGAVTIAQDRETCVVDGMPGEAIGLGAADHELSPDEIASFLSRLVSKGRTPQPDFQPTNLIT